MFFICNVNLHIYNIDLKIATKFYELLNKYNNKFSCKKLIYTIYNHITITIIILNNTFYTKRILFIELFFLC